MFNRGFSTNFYLGTPTNDSWTKFYGSSAKEKKTKLGKVNNYYRKTNIVSVIIEQNKLNRGDEICFTGPSTGFYKIKVEEIWVNKKPVKTAKKGDEVTFRTEKKLRISDTAFKIEKRDINKEEQETRARCEDIGIHKPFKFLKKDKGMK